MLQVIPRGEALGQKLQEYMSAGQIVPEDLVIDVLSNGIKERGGVMLF